MTFPRQELNVKQGMRGILLLVVTLAMAACAESDRDDTTGSRFGQLPPNSPPRPTTDVDDIAIAGQDAARAILDLPAVANAGVPPLVQFTGVTSIVKGPAPVDTEPYTTLLRDRLLLLTRLKLRFIEHTLPPLMAGSRGKKHASSPSIPMRTDPDFQIFAELRGQYESSLYRIEIQFVDAHNNEVLFDGLYRIRKEAGSAFESESYAPQPPPDVPSAPPQPPPRSSPLEPTDPNYYQPRPAAAPDGTGSLQ